jgi:hypothetical protein
VSSDVEIGERVDEGVRGERGKDDLVSGEGGAGAGGRRGSVEELCGAERVI